MKIWQKKYETKPVKDLQQIQLERLQATIYRIFRHGVAFYRRQFEESGFDPENVTSIKDLERLPLTTREDLKESYPYDLFAVSLRDVVRIHESSGDTGIVGYTRSDLDNWSGLVARTLCASGIDEEDHIQITHPYGLFPGALGYHYAAELIGASVIPSSTASTDKQIQIMKDYRTTALACTPTYAIRLITELIERRIEPERLALKYVVLGSEPWSNEKRREIENGLSVSASFNYGVATVFGPGVASECREKSGLHIFMDHFIPEIIDPYTKRTLPLGREGELVLTTLTREAFPLLRFRTGDVTSLYYDDERCPCGRTHIKMKPVTSRTDELFVFRGVNFYPKQIGDLLLKVEGTVPEYHIKLTRENSQDYMYIEVEVTEEVFFDQMKRQKKIFETIENQFRRDFTVSASIKPVERGSLARKKRVDDTR